MQQTKSNRVFNIILIFLILFSLFSTFLAIRLDNNFLMKFSPDNDISSSTLEKINIIRFFLLIKGTVLLLFSILILNKKEKFLSFLRKHKSFFQGFLLLIILLIIFFTLGEIICRILFYEKTSNFGIGPGTLKFNEKYIQLNNEGMRDDNFSLDKKEKYRIAVIGDSYTYGFGVKNISDVYPNILENLLNNNTKEYEVMNFGVPGIYLDGELELYREKIKKYSPDIIILGFVLRDLNNVDKNLTFGKSKWYSIPYFGFLFREVSYFYFYLESQFNKMISLANPSNSYENLILEAYNSSINREYNKKIFEEFSKELNGKRAIIVIFPLVSNWEKYPFLEAHEFIKDISKKNNFHIIDLYDSYKEYREIDLIVNREDTHPNELAHKIAAEKIYENLITENFNYN